MSTDVSVKMGPVLDPPPELPLPPQQHQRRHTRTRITPEKRNKCDQIQNIHGEKHRMMNTNQIFIAPKPHSRSRAEEFKNKFEDKILSISKGTNHTDAANGLEGQTTHKRAYPQCSQSQHQQHRAQRGSRRARRCRPSCRPSHHHRKRARTRTPSRRQAARPPARASRGLWRSL